jgi:hypothetical protein
MVPSRILVVILLGPSWVLSLHAGDGALDRETLRGLKALKVVCDSPDERLQHAGITKEEWQAQIEQKLRSAGVTIDQNAKEFLGLSVMSAQERKTPLAVSASLGLYQVATLGRNAAVKTVTETWLVDTVRIAQPKAAHRVSDDMVDQLVDKFLAAYRSVNSAAAGLD